MASDTTKRQLGKTTKHVTHKDNHRNAIAMRILIVILILSFGYFFISRPQQILESYLQDHHFGDFLASLQQPAPSPPFKFIMFHPVEGGQGIGNIMNGLLAAHLLAEEFDRVVCITDHWVDFYKAFVPLHNRTQCADLLQDPTQAKDTERIGLLNFGAPTNECRVKQLLASDQTVLFFTGNTYPRWKEIPDKYWDQFYTTTERMKRLLQEKWKQPIQTVVHLRLADGEMDSRQGLDPATLTALGSTLPNNTFLVTNNVQWYTFFERQYHWSNPGWSSIRHSAFSSLEWGPTLRNAYTDEDHMMNLWCDWYTILMAEKVIHTHSDFSLSAIHWRNLESKTIQGVDQNGSLVLIDEPWRREQSVIPLVQRKENELKNCLEELTMLT